MRKLALKVFIFIFLVGTIWFQQPVEVTQAGINDDLVSYWKYDEGEDNTCVGSEDICDSQGSNHGERAGDNGTNIKPQWSASQKPTLATTNPYALDFDGSDDEITGIGDINFSGNAFSVSAWVYPDNWGVSGDAYIHNILCDEAGPDDVDITNTTMCFRIGSKGQDALKQKIALMIHDETNSNDFESTTNLALDTWTHVAVTWDGLDVKFYINGSLDRTQSGPGLVMNDGTLGFRMGSAPSASRYFDGGLDELRLYDRALTAPEINELATINPGVNTLSPVDGATSVGVDDNLVITFDKDMQAVTEKNVYIKRLSNDSVVETIASDDAKITIVGATVTINPTTTLDEKTAYYVNIDSGAFEDLSSNDYSGMSGNESWNFTTEDTVAPTVSYLSPVDDATGVGVAATFEINFVEDVATSTGNIYLYKSSDDSLAETIDVAGTYVTASGTTAFIINPSTTLDSETEYYFIIQSGAVKDSSGNNFIGITASTTWSFITADVDAPTATLSPLDNNASTSIDSNLVMTFSENIATSTGNIIIYKTSDDSLVETITPLSSNFSVSSNIATINPTSDFSYSTEYYIVVPTTLFDDLASNSYAGLIASTTWSFTTEDTPDCPSIANVATYNSYPICGVATCNEGYTLTNGACAAVSGGGALIPPSSIGTGQVDQFIPMYEERQIGEIKSEGTNMLMYIKSKANFKAIVSKNLLVEEFNLKILDLNMITKKIKIEFLPTQKIIELNIADSKKIDFDNDGINDINIIYNELLINQIDLTIEQLEFKQEQVTNEDEQVKKQKNIFSNGELLKENNKPTVYLIEDNKKRAFFNEEAFLFNGYEWEYIKNVEDLSFVLTGEMIYTQEDNLESSNNKYYFANDLELGVKSEDVRELQKFLNNNGFILTKTGPGYPGNETDFFGRLTWYALMEFQKEKGIKPISGYFGPLTRKFINSK